MEPAKVNGETVSVSTAGKISKSEKTLLRLNKINLTFAKPDLILSDVMAALNALWKPAKKSSLAI